MVNVDVKKCIGCGSCAADCPIQSIRVKDGKAVPGQLCLECGHCTALCKQKAVTLLGDYDPSEVLEYDDPKKFADCTGPAPEFCQISAKRTSVYR